MLKISKEHPGKKGFKVKDLGLPYMKSVRLALNVASCDSRRLVVVYAPKPEDRNKLEALLTPLAWSHPIAGDFVYVAADKAKDLESIRGLGDGPGLIVVAPSDYGLVGSQVAFIKPGTDAKQVKATLVAAADANKMGSKDSKKHIGRGRRYGMEWETETPVTDRGDRGRRRRR